MPQANPAEPWGLMVDVQQHMPDLKRNVQPSTVTTALTGYHLLADHLLNKGTAFTDEERGEFELHGLLPPTIATLDQQVSRRLAAFRGFTTDLERYAFLRDLQDTNET